MSMLWESQRTQEAQRERLRKLQLDKISAPPDRKEIIQAEIEIAMKEIEKLEAEIQRLISEGRTPRGKP